MCKFYESETESWYWFEGGKLFGGYETAEEVEIERHCVIGSEKYFLLSQTRIKPRIGDFVADGISRGLVSRLDVQLNGHDGFLYTNGKGEECFAEYSKYRWIAPVEWK